MHSLYRRAVVYGLIIISALVTVLPNVLPVSVRDNFPAWYSDNQVNLGLDLRGGSYLLLEVDARQLLIDENRQFSDALTAALRENGIRYSAPAITEDGMTIAIRDAVRVDQALDLAREISAASADATTPRQFDFSAQGASLTMAVTRVYSQAAVSDAVEQSVEVVRRRLNESGLVEPSITRQGNNGIAVQLPGVTEPARIRDLLGTTAKMSFHWAADSRSDEVMTLPAAESEGQYVLEQAAAMEGRHVVDARVGYDPLTSEPVVTFRLDKAGGRIFGEMTGANVGRVLAVVLDELVITAPVINEPILGGSGEISGNFNASDAADLAVMLRAGALPAELNVVEERTVGPNLGSDAIRVGIISTLAGGLLVLAFMASIYGTWGLLAWAGLSVNLMLIFSVLTLFNATLTLPGIAGIVLVIGMAVDANILINERIREELRSGSSPLQALNTGFGKAWNTILDSNVTTLIAVSLLFTIGSGPVQGFAVTMGIGLLTSMFSAVAVTRVLMEWRVRCYPRRPLRMGGLPLVARLSERLGSGDKAIDFMRAGFAGLIVSAVLSTASLGLMVKPGMEYGIDFSGGALLEARTASVTIDELRDAFSVSPDLAPEIQEFGAAGDYQLRVPLQDSEGESGQVVIDELKATLLSLDPSAVFSRAEVVGPGVSGNFADLSILAVITAGLGMLLYLWLRFERHFAGAAILTIVLDLTKTAGFFVLTGLEFNLTAVAALLALIGYSVNDKVVVFDRIRENLQSNPDEPLTQVLNRSITATLPRTLLTSASTFIALLPMALAGGEAVASFAQPLLFGIVVGTSSSIFIAAPIVLRLSRRRERLGLPLVRQARGLTEEELARP